MTERKGQEQLNESISALVDGQASEMELRRIMKAAETDQEVRATWARYQAVSQTLQGDTPPTLNIDLSNSIRDAIDAEPDHKQGWLHNLSKMAIAASVAGAVVFTAQFTNQQLEETPEVASSTQTSAVSPATLSLPAGFQAPSVAARTVSSEAQINPAPVERQQVPAGAQVILKSKPGMPNEEVQDHIQEVMSLHAEESALNSNRGMLPYARVPAPDQEQ
ncbi:MAG: anti sigma-E factor RseA C-terminal domain-containing protein [Candidatus Pelagadaptatus aseana]|uniref:sigma-E factor negative regulatory protein n=1 Tax=Candidatus Pelagadaptatus aseana TaxID=3120508 RepID=UPI0039B2609B